MGKDAPADPPFHPILAMIATAIQPMAPFEPADPPFDPRTPVTATAEPALLFVGDAFGRFRTRFGQHPLLDATFGGVPLIIPRVHAAVPG